MHEKRIGGLHVSVTGEKITFALAGNHEQHVALDTQFHKELIEFLNAFKVERQESRVGFRVPLSSELYEQLGRDFNAVLSVEGDVLPFPPKDLSLTGISFDLGNKTELCPAVGEKVAIVLSLGRETLTLSGMVRRREKRLIGVSFESEVEKTTFEAPDDLVHMVRDLERIWLQMQRRAF